MQNQGHIVRMICAALVSQLFTACAADVYREDVLTFKTSVDGAVTAFDGLRDNLQAKIQKDLEDELAKSSQRINFVGIEMDGEALFCGDIVETKLSKDTQCMAQWATYRATSEDSRGDPPNCVEPAGYYVLPLTEEQQACQLGAELSDDSGDVIVDPSKLTEEALLENASELGSGLQAYAAALLDLANSEDSEQLRSAVGDAKNSILKLADTVKKVSEKEVLNKETFGPVADLLGTALVQFFEYRRFVAMKGIVEKADETVTAAAQLLTRVSMPPVIPELRKLANEVSDKVADVNTAVAGPDYQKKLNAAWKARDNYLAAYASHPSTAFKAMAEAHIAIKNALLDPKTQFDNMKDAIKEFAEKAKVVKAALEKE